MSNPLMCIQIYPTAKEITKHYKQQIRKIRDTERSRKGNNKIFIKQTLEVVNIPNEQVPGNKINTLNINVNDIDGYIELYVFDENPLVSSQIAKKAQIILQNSIIDFKLNICKIYHS